MQNCLNCDHELLLDFLFLIKGDTEPRGDHGQDGVKDGVKDGPIEEAPIEEALGNNM